MDILRLLNWVLFLAAAIVRGIMPIHPSDTQPSPLPGWVLVVLVLGACGLWIGRRIAESRSEVSETPVTAPAADPVQLNLPLAA